MCDTVGNRTTCAVPHERWFAERPRPVIVLVSQLHGGTRDVSTETCTYPDDFRSPRSAQAVALRFAARKKGTASAAADEVERWACLSSDTRLGKRRG